MRAWKDLQELWAAPYWHTFKRNLQVKAEKRNRPQMEPTTNSARRAITKLQSSLNISRLTFLFSAQQKDYLITPYITFLFIAEIRAQS